MTRCGQVVSKQNMVFVHGEVDIEVMDTTERLLFILGDCRSNAHKPGF